MRRCTVVVIMLGEDAGRIVYCYTKPAPLSFWRGVPVIYRSAVRMFTLTTMECHHLQSVLLKILHIHPPVANTTSVKFINAGSVHLTPSDQKF